MNNSSARFGKVLSAVTAFSKNKYVKSVSDSMMTLIGIMVFGSFAVILKAFPIPSVAAYFEKIGIAPYFGAIYNLTIGAISIYLVFLIAKNLASKFNFGDESTTVGLIAIMNFLILTPLGNFVSGESNVTAIPLKWLGTSGMFSAIIIGLLVARGYVFIKEKKWTIKMPPGVPPMVSRSFESLIPTILLGTLSGIIGYLFSLTSFGNMHQLMFTILQNPLQGIGSSIWAIMLIIAFQQFLWFLGIHGTNIITPVVAPVLMALNVDNLAAYEAGKELPHIVTHAFVNIICWGGTALGLVLLMLFVGKSKRYKELGKLSVVPALFGITEPVIFGTPLVLNFKMAFPFIFNNSICLGVAYLLTNVGLVSKTIGAQAVFGLPLGFHASVGGSVSIIILQVAIQLVLSPLLWYPWFKMLDKEAVLEEQKNLAE